ncbi:MAG: hypothetical protein MZU95_16445 [Desulfomicrobium escambiense]|nr:hypothetical protein [Desulfomicrobium escambiense]
MTVYRLIGRVRCPFTETVFWEETYARLGGGDVPTAMWVKRPRGQLLKRAKAASLRAAFPEEASYTAEEMAGRSLEAELVTAPVAASAPVSTTATAVSESRPRDGRGGGSRRGDPGAHRPSGRARPTESGLGHGPGLCPPALHRRRARLRAGQTGPGRTARRPGGAGRLRPNPRPARAGPTPGGRPSSGTVSPRLPEDTLMHIIDLVQRSPEWQAWRAGGVTASEAAVILGRSPYQTPWRLQAEKTGLCAPAGSVGQPVRATGPTVRRHRPSGLRDPPSDPAAAGLVPNRRGIRCCAAPSTASPTPASRSSSRCPPSRPGRRSSARARQAWPSSSTGSRCSSSCSSPRPTAAGWCSIRSRPGGWRWSSSSRVMRPSSRRTGARLPGFRRGGAHPSGTRARPGARHLCPRRRGPWTLGTAGGRASRPPSNGRRARRGTQARPGAH